MAAAGASKYGMLGMRNTPLRSTAWEGGGGAGSVTTPTKTSLATSTGSRPGTPVSRAGSPTKRGMAAAAASVKGENVCVAVRFRPWDARERRAQGAEAEVWTVDEGHHRIKMTGEQLEKMHKLTDDNAYTFDYVFDGQGCRQEALYRSTVSPIVHLSMEGYNGLVFAYGATGSGKTWTMSGSSENPGVMSRAIEEIFSLIQKDHRRRYLLRASYLEIYNEDLRDLLAPETSPKIAEDNKGRPFVKPLTEKIVTTPNEVYDVLEFGMENRHVGSTDWNERSSRSHTVFNIVIESELLPGIELSGDASDKVKMSKISLIDLAGSERATSQESRRVEGAHINRSLLSLRLVISKLVEKSAHIPFRDSKLTRLLQPSLSGDARIAVICTASPAESSITDTSNTLKFAAGCKQVTTQAKQGIVASDQSALISQYEAEILALQSRLEKVHSQESQKVLSEVAELQMERTMLRKQIETMENQLLSQASVNRRVSSQVNEMNRRSMRHASSSKPPIYLDPSARDLEKIQQLQRELDQAKETIDRSDVSARNHLTKVSALEQELAQERKSRLEVESVAHQLRQKLGSVSAGLEEERERSRTDADLVHKDHENIRREKEQLEQSLALLVERYCEPDQAQPGSDLISKIAAIVKNAGERTLLEQKVHDLEAQMLTSTQGWADQHSAQDQVWRARADKMSMEMAELRIKLEEAQASLERSELRSAAVEKDRAGQTETLRKLELGLAEKEDEVRRMLDLTATWRKHISRYDAALNTLLNSQPTAAKTVDGGAPAPLTPRRSRRPSTTPYDII